jgi:AcrR family transcriptional regulator
VTRPAPSKADEAVRRSLHRRQETAQAEVARLIEVGRELFGGGANPRVADVVRAAGVSIEAFYRYFGSKGEFVAAVAEDGSHRVTTYVAHKVAGAPDPARRLRAAVEALMSQAAKPELAAAARNILALTSTDGTSFETAVAELLAPILGDLGSGDPGRDARLAAVTLVGVLQGHVWGGTRPTRGDIDHLTAFLTRAVRA